VLKSKILSFIPSKFNSNTSLANPKSKPYLCARFNDVVKSYN
jgi:hypothetical protein